MPEGPDDSEGGVIAPTNFPGLWHSVGVWQRQTPLWSRPSVRESLLLIGWIAVGVVGFAIALSASRRVADRATAVVERTNVSPFFVGVVLLAVGTDIPEIVNSLITSASGHGDLNVGDSVGSALTQVTLVLGLLPFLAGRVKTEGRAVQAIGSLTVVALLIGVLMVVDGRLGRVESAALILGWLVAMYLTRHVGRIPDRTDEAKAGGPILRHIVVALVFLVIVGGGAALAVLAMIRTAGLLAVPEYVISFFGASLGTSLPELMVDVTAIRRGAVGLAIGDAFGSSLVDATVSLGIGPLFFPIVVDASRAVPGGLYAAVAVALVTLLLGWRTIHDRRSGVAALLLYAAAYFVVLQV